MMETKEKRRHADTRRIRPNFLGATSVFHCELCQMIEGMDGMKTEEHVLYSDEPAALTERLRWPPRVAHGEFP